MKLLSLCIPTYNHAAFLEKMLERVVSLTAFASGEVEVVLSDNASTDSTQAVGEKYATAYPGRIVYFRNERNVFDANFALALSRGNGAFLKLANDTLLFTDDGLSSILETIRTHLQTKPILFFSNLLKEPHTVRCVSFDELFSEISFHSTWIGSFGIWREDFVKLPDFARARELQLTQVDVLCRMMKEKMNAVVNGQVFATSMPRGKIGGYNLAKVFGRNYFSILREYVSNGDLSRKAFSREKFRMLRYHILPFYLSFGSNNAFPKSGYVRYLLKDYWTSPFFWTTVPFVVGAELGTAVRGLFRKV